MVIFSLINFVVGTTQGYTKNHVPPTNNLGSICLGWGTYGYVWTN